MLFDIALSGETDSQGVIHHTPITPGRPIKPFSLKMPSLSFDGETKKCELCKYFLDLYRKQIVVSVVIQNRFSKLEPFLCFSSEKSQKFGTKN